MNAYLRVPGTCLPGMTIWPSLLAVSLLVLLAGRGLSAEPALSASVSGKGLQFEFNPMQPAGPIPADRVLFVDGTQGSDDKTGRTEREPLKTLAKAMSLVTPGDTVVLKPGVYHGSVEVATYGTAEAPITIRADQNEKNRVVLTQADPAILANAKQDLWTEDPSTPGLYSTPYDQGGWPVRVLYDDIDLYPYPNLDGLKAFLSYIEPPWRTKPYPGPTHGMYWDAASKKLYVRLKEGWGDTNPNHRAMFVAPPHSAYKALQPRKPADWMIAFRRPGQAHYRIEGISFKTSASCGIFLGLDVSHLLIRNCHFTGLPWGVAGSTDAPERGAIHPRTLKSSDHVTVEHCVYSQFPTFTDAVEQVARVRAHFGGQLPDVGDDKPLENFFWWRRKHGHHSTEDDPDPAFRRPTSAAMTSYENGIVLRAGRNWKVNGNFLVEVIDGLGSYAVDTSIDLEVAHNVAARMVDNFCETESHSQNMRVYDNLVIDAYEPFSFQPLGGHEWPDGSRIHHNVATLTKPGEAWMLAIPRASLQNRPAAFKIMFKTSGNWPKKPDAKPEDWLGWMLKVPKDYVELKAGWAAYNNTILQRHGTFFEFAGMHDKVTKGFIFANNLVMAEDASNNDRKRAPVAYRNWVLQKNLIVRSPHNTDPLADHRELMSLKLGESGWWHTADVVEQKGQALAIVAGGGFVFDGLESAGLVNPAQHDYSLQENSPARGAGVTAIEGYEVPGIHPDLGALPYGKASWMIPVLTAIE